MYTAPLLINSKLKIVNSILQVKIGLFYKNRAKNKLYFHFLTYFQMYYCHPNHLQIAKFYDWILNIKKIRV